jgi:hypothetical protein
MKTYTCGSKKPISKLNKYYNNFFITEHFFKDKFDIGYSSICYPMLYRNISIFYLEG